MKTCLTASGSETNTQVPSCGSLIVNMSPYRARHSSSVGRGRLHQCHIVRASDVMVLNKVDLLPHVPFSVERCVENARRVNPRLQVLPVSALRGDGLDAWLGWIRGPLRTAAAAHSAE